MHGTSEQNLCCGMHVGCQTGDAEAAGTQYAHRVLSDATWDLEREDWAGMGVVGRADLGKVCQAALSLL